MNPITVQVSINATVEKVWDCFTKPEHIVKWNFAADTWHAPWAKNDLRIGGKLLWRMEAKDGSFGFDFEGNYLTIKPNQLIEYAIVDGRNVSIVFESKGLQTLVTETFEPETENSIELQQGGWQAILNNFKKHAETI